LDISLLLLLLLLLWLLIKRSLALLCLLPAAFHTCLRFPLLCALVGSSSSSRSRLSAAPVGSWLAAAAGLAILLAAWPAAILSAAALSASIRPSHWRAATLLLLLPVRRPGIQLVSLRGLLLCFCLAVRLAAQLLLLLLAGCLRLCLPAAAGPDRVTTLRNLPAAVYPLFIAHLITSCPLLLHLGLALLLLLLLRTRRPACISIFAACWPTAAVRPPISLLLPFLLLQSSTRGPILSSFALPAA
jgi:hypothetical protein